MLTCIIKLSNRLTCIIGKNKKMYYMTEPNGHLRYFISQIFVRFNKPWIVVLIHAVEIT